MNSLRRLSHAISEGAGISLLVEVNGADAARAAEAQGADGVFVVHGSERPRRAPGRHPPADPFFDGQRPECRRPDAGSSSSIPDDAGLEQLQLELSAFELAYRVTETDKPRTSSSGSTWRS